MAPKKVVPAPEAPPPFYLEDGTLFSVEKTGQSLADVLAAKDLPPGAVDYGLGVLPFVREVEDGKAYSPEPQACKPITTKPKMLRSVDKMVRTSSAGRHSRRQGRGFRFVLPWGFSILSLRFAVISSSFAPN